jgi:hypothetical protein
MHALCTHPVVKIVLRSERISQYLKKLAKSPHRPILYIELIHEIVNENAQRIHKPSSQIQDLSSTSTLTLY